MQEIQGWSNKDKRDMKWSVTTVDRRGISRQDARPMHYSVVKREIIRKSGECVDMEWSKDGMFVILCWTQDVPGLWFEET